MTKIIGISIKISDGEDEDGIHSSFYFRGATVEQLYAINSELDILKKEILDRIKDAPKEYEVEEFEDGEENHT